MRYLKNTLVLSLALAAVSAFAQAAAPASVDNTILSTVQAQMALAARDIVPMAIGWLSAFLTLQFVLTHIRVLAAGGDLTDLWPKLLTLILTATVAYYLMTNGPDFIDSVGHGILDKFTSNIPGPAAIIAATIGLCGTLVTAIFFVGPIHPAIANILTYMMLAVFCGGMFLAAKVFMLYLELGMAVLLSPLSFSFLGLNAMRETGIAPFKALVSLGFRAIVLGICYGGITKVFDVMGTSIDSVNWLDPSSLANVLKALFNGLAGIPILVYMIFKSDAWAAQLASGHTSMGPADIASTAAAGAAMGAMGGAAAGALGATSPIQSMSSFMQSLGGGTQVSNGGGMGSGGGGSSAGTSPVTSLGDAPKHPATPPSPYETGSKGQPLPTSRKSSSGSPSGASSSNVQAAKDFASTNPGSAKTGQEISDFASTLSPQSGAATASAAAGHGKGANIGGLDSTSPAPKPDPVSQPSNFQKFGRGMGELGRQIEKEKTPTQISINVGNSD